MKAGPKITVLTSCFNASEFLEEAIGSILSQSFRDFEYILVNDGSTDNTLDIIKRFASLDGRIIVLSKQNTGYEGFIDVLNKGIAMARGEWIARFDADDIAMPERLKRQVEFVSENPKTVLLGCGCVEIDRNGSKLKQHSYPLGHFELVRRMERLQPFFPHSSAFFNKKEAQRVGCYRRRILYSEDVDLWLRMSNTGSVRCLREPLIKLRRHSSSILSKHAASQQVMGISAIVCHLRHQAGLVDPSQSDDQKWQKFITWIERRLGENGYLADFKKWQSFRLDFCECSGVSYFFKLIVLFLYIVKHPKMFLSKAKQKLFGKYVTLELFEESREWC